VEKSSSSEEFILLKNRFFKVVAFLKKTIFLRAVEID